MSELISSLGLLYIVLVLGIPVLIFIMFCVLCWNIGRIRDLLQQALTTKKKVR